MALTLRELLDKNRAEREARERASTGGQPSHLPAPAQAQDAIGSQAVAPPGPPTPPAPSITGRGLLSRLSKGADNANQSTQAPSAPTPVGAETVAPVVQKSVATAHPISTSNGTASPSFTVDETETLKKNLAFLAANLDEPQIVGQILRTTVRQIQAAPELSAIMIDSDFDLIVLGARKAGRYVQRKKEEKSDARTKKQSQKAELEAFLKDSGIDLDSL